MIIMIQQYVNLHSFFLFAEFFCTFVFPYTFLVSFKRGRRCGVGRRSSIYLCSFSKQRKFTVRIATKVTAEWNILEKKSYIHVDAAS